MTFAFLFLGEYLHVIVMSNLMVIIFLGGWLPLPFLSMIPIIGPFIVGLVPPFVWYGLKLWFILFAFMWVRATFPRFRYDQLMSFG